MVELSVVIPAFNEEARLPATLRAVRDHLQGSRPYEIIVIDDGSTDGTAAAAEGFFRETGCGRVLRNERNRGKGFSVRRGMLEARGRLRLFSDADLSTPIAELAKLEAALAEGFDAAIASRSLPGSDVRIHQPRYRELMGKAFNRLVRALAVPGFIDTQCGFKLFTAGAAREVFSRLTVERFAFDVEAVFIARKLGCRVKEVPVVWVHSAPSKVHPVTDAARMLFDLVLMRFRRRGSRPGS